MKTRILCLLAFLCFLQLQAQQRPISNFYTLNSYLLNPAEAGQQQQTQGFLSHRLQWQGIEGAPKTTFGGIHGAINETMGLGGRVFVDQTNLLQQLSLALSYSYRIQLSDRNTLRFGVSGIMNQNNIQFEKANFNDAGDELIDLGNQSEMGFDTEVGILLQLPNTKIGLASSQLLQSGEEFDLSNRSGTFEKVRVFSLYGSHSFTLKNPDWQLEPSIIVQHQGKGSFQLESSALLKWQETLFIGVGYRQDAGIISRIGVQFAERLTAAYAYEFSTSGIASYSSGSHEFMLGFQLFKIEKKKKNNAKEVPFAPIEPKETIQKIQSEGIKEKTIQPKQTVKETPVTQEVKPAQKTPIEKRVEQETEIEEPQLNETKKEELPKLDEIIYFDFKETSLSDKGKLTLQKVIKQLTEFPSSQLNIVGHTCNLGSDSINQFTSLARANAVKNYLISKGIDSHRLLVTALSDKKPAVSNDTFENRKKNRRVEMQLVTE